VFKSWLAKLGWVLLALRWAYEAVDAWANAEFIRVKTPEILRFLYSDTALLIITFLALVLIWRGSRMGIPSQQPTPPPPQGIQGEVYEGFTLEGQRILLERLKSYADEHTNVKVKIATARQRPLADSLISIFQLAGWRTAFPNVPLESYLHGQYFEGVEVRGYNKHFVESVADALAKAGLANVKPIVEQSQIQPENPKWASVQRSIYITLGHER
jgi:hypothetical protein